MLHCAYALTIPTSFVRLCAPLWLKIPKSFVRAVCGFFSVFVETKNPGKTAKIFKTGKTAVIFLFYA
jgi:hypothetical protein